MPLIPAPGESNFFWLPFTYPDSLCPLFGYLSNEGLVLGL